MQKIEKGCSLVILAAGMGTRFGKGIKQLEQVGPSGEIIMDYSIHDAIEVGFDRIVFIIRKDIEASFRAVIGDRIKKICDQKHVAVAYAYQDSNDLPDGFCCPKERSKPWGTGHALLACRELLDDPFVVINADDYYGKEAFRELHDFLAALPAKSTGKYCMAGFQLGHTLSEHGAVTRGICQADEMGHLQHVFETKNIVKTKNGAVIQCGDTLTPVDTASVVSMNMWGFTPDVLPRLQEAFNDFLQKNLKVPGAEFLIPIEMEKLLTAGKVDIHVLPTSDCWYGMTYQEDIPAVREAFRRMTEQGFYKKPLYGE